MNHPARRFQEGIKSSIKTETIHKTKTTKTYPTKNHRYQILQAATSKSIRVIMNMSNAFIMQSTR